MTLKQRFIRSCLYAIAVVVASILAVLALLFLQHPGHLSEGFLDRATYVIGAPLGPGALVSFGIFGSMGSCATNGQIAGLFLIPVFSIVIDAGLIFAVWEFLHRKKSRGLNSESFLHING
jgi:hypothetical protein